MGIMPAHDELNDSGDSLDRVERRLAIEEMMTGKINADLSLTPDQREQLISEVQARLDSGEFDNEDDWDDDVLGVLVRKLGPRGPHGRSGIAARPETEQDGTSAGFTPTFGDPES
jgi:hypothetical protein